MRSYRGVKAADRLADRRGRLLEAGLDILGSDSGLSELTVRGVCALAGVTTRYFYESFTDKDAFAAAVYDWVIAELATGTQAAVAAAPPREQGRAGMASIVGVITRDSRRGRLLFDSTVSNPVIARKRVESIALFTSLLGEHVNSTLPAAGNDRIKAATHFVVGGVTQTISAWLDGAVHLQPDELVDQLAVMLDVLADPALYRG